MLQGKEEFLKGIISKKRWSDSKGPRIPGFQGSSEMLKSVRALKSKN
jgi:hypothetical protein